MAVELITQPKKYSPVFWSVAWDISLDDLGTDPIKIYWGGYLAFADNTRITDDIPYKPFAADVQFTKEFRSHCGGLVKTSFPTDASTATVDTNIIKQVKLKYGTVTFNTDNCPDGGEKEFDFDSNTINIINANANVETQQLFGNSAGFISPRTGLLLSQRPAAWTLCHGAKDYLWYLGVGTMTIKYYSGSTQIGSTQSFTLSGATTVKYVALDYNQYSIAKPTHAIILVNDGTAEPGTEYRINYCDCVEQDNYLGVMFLEPMGGRSMFHTGIPESVDIERSGTTVVKAFDLSQTQHKTGGETFFIPKGTKKVSFKMELERSTGIETWISNFFSSAGHHAQRGYGANLKWEKFILDSGTYKVLEKNKLVEVTFTGYVGEGIRSQNSDI